LTHDCIAAADGWFNRIRQAPPMCLPIWARWRHLANAVEFVLPSALASPQRKWQIDRFSHFCTAHDRVSLGTLAPPGQYEWNCAHWCHLANMIELVLPSA